jgi:hypothetical protein
MLKIEVNAGIEKADSEGFQIETAAQVVDLGSSFHGKAKTFQPREKPLSTEATENFRACVAVALDEPKASHEVEVQIGFEKNVLKKFQANHVIRR